MNGSYYPNPLDQFKRFFSSKTALPRLILINIFIFAFVNLVQLFLWLFRVQTEQGLSLITSILAVPASIDTLALKPWTILTYMFFHEGFFHLLFNMMVLYFGGIIFMQYLNERQLIWTYLFGGLTGAAFYVMAFNFFPVFLEATPFAIALGASASVLSILIAIAAYVPHYTVNLLFIGQVKLKYLAVFFILMDIFSIQGDNPGGHIAHLGGAFWGILYGITLRYHIDILPFIHLKRKKSNLRVNTPGVNSSGSTNRRPLSDDDYNKQKNINQQQIDQILDKISRSGYESLTQTEKAILFKNSKQ